MAEKNQKTAPSRSGGVQTIRDDRSDLVESENTGHSNNYMTNDSDNYG